MSSSHCLIRALFRQPVDYTPIWIMRQAGRHLPEYRQLRSQVPDFLTFCKTPDLTVAATIQPLQRYPLDAAIIFSDILVIPEAMGMSIKFVSGEGPVISNPIRNEADINSLKLPEVEEALSFVFTAIKWSVKELSNKVPLIGFAGSPWTCAAYMVEGGSSKNFEMLKRFMFCKPELMHFLLDKITKMTVRYLQAQIDAGAEVLMIFDTWGGLLSPVQYQLFSLNYMTRIAASLSLSNQEERVPIIFFTKGGGCWLEKIANGGCDAIGLDWTIDIGEAEARVGKKVSLQGNMDPLLLYAPIPRIEQEAKSILDSFISTTGHVFNLGHGITPQTSPEHVQALVETVHNYSRMLKRQRTELK